MDDTALDGIEVFASLSRADRAELTVGMSPFRAADGETLFEQGDPPGPMYLLREGSVRLSVRVASEGVRDIVDVPAGEAVGTFGMIDPAPRSATATAIGDTAGVVLPRAVFASARAALRPAAYALLRPLARQLAQDARDLIASLAPDVAQITEAPAVDRNRWEVKATGHRRGQLDSLPPLASFTPGELDRLLDGGTWLDVPRGEVVLARGEPAGPLGIVVRGAVQGTIPLGDGDVLRLPLAAPGQTIGEIARIAGGPQPLAYAAREPATIAGLPLGRVVELMDAHDPAGFKMLDLLLGTLVAHLRRANRRMVHVHASRRTDAE